MTGTPLVIPKVSFPFPGRLHPEWKAIEQGTLDWALSFDLVSSPADERRIRDALFGKALARMYPSGPVERVLSISLLSILWFVFDDRVVEPSSSQGAYELLERALIMDEIARDPASEPDSADPYHRAYRDVWKRFRRLATPGQAVRMQRAMLGTLLSCATEKVAVDQRIPLPGPVYRRVRHGTSLLSTFVTFMEVVGQFEVPLHVHADPEVQELIRTGISVFTTMNDIYSCPIDARRGHAMNLPSVLARERRCSLQEGIDLAVAELRADTDRFLRLADRLTGRENLPPLIEAIKDANAGINVWYHETRRYDPRQR